MLIVLIRTETAYVFFWTDPVVYSLLYTTSHHHHRLPRTKLESV